MPEIRFKDHVITAESGSNLRRILLDNKMGLYNGAAKFMNCRGLGTCGTCAVKIRGEVSAPTAIERWRLGFPPHRRSADLRLACQCTVLGDLHVTKGSGLWGQHVPPEGR